jgi:hypothetical protein
MPKLPDRDPTPVTELAKALDKHVATVYRWGSPRGVRGHRLRLTRIGGRTYVYHADWEAFENALNADHVPGSQDPARARGQREDGIDAELDAAGF